MTYQKSQPDEVGAENADELGVLDIDEPGEPTGLAEEDREALVGASQRLAGCRR